MSSHLPRFFVSRHGDTAWTDSRRRTGRIGVPLNGRGEERACPLGEQLQRFPFVGVFTRPLQWASKTCELADFGAVAEVDPNLAEWDYGRFGGTLTNEILKKRAARPGTLP